MGDPFSAPALSSVEEESLVPTLRVAWSWKKLVLPKLLEDNDLQNEFLRREPEMRAGVHGFNARNNISGNSLPVRGGEGDPPSLTADSKENCAKSLFGK